MQHIRYIDGELYVEKTAIRRIIEKYGTPLFVYSKATIIEQYRLLSSALSEINPLICYAVKANTTGAIIAILAREGAGADVVSIGELYRSLRAGIPASKIVFAGVGKTLAEIEDALNTGIFSFTVESIEEAVRISSVAKRAGTIASVMLRVNPEVDANTHHYITTGTHENKFGILLSEISSAFDYVTGLPAIEVIGIHMHIGSQILTVEPFVKAISRITDLCFELKRKIKSFRYIDVGGGLGIAYRPEEKDLTPDIYASAVVPIVKKIGLSMIVEPGRFLVGNAGLLVCEVQYIKKSRHKNFVIVNAGMNDLIRPALYDAYHHVLSVRKTDATIRGDLVGPVCESGDFFALDRELPAVSEGDLLVIAGAGAYGSVMSSNYNSRPRAGEVLIDNEDVYLIRKPETLRDLVAKEKIPQ